MVIEWLRIPVPPALQGAFLHHDRVIWTEFLARQPGFAGKECWRDPDSPEILHLVIRWDSLSAWHAVPKPLLQLTNHAFAAALGTAYPVAACTRLDVLPSSTADKV